MRIYPRGARGITKRSGRGAIIQINGLLLAKKRKTG